MERQHISAEALARKEKSSARLRQRNIPTSIHLPVIEDTSSARKRSKEQIAHRAIALCIVAVKGEGLEQKEVLDLVKRYEAQSFFTPDEKKFIENPAPTKSERAKFGWRYEDYWVMLWALGYIDKLNYPDTICDVSKAVKTLLSKTPEKFVQDSQLRNLSEILDEADLIYRYDWAAVDARIHKRVAPARLNEEVVLERHHALNWLIGAMDQEWDDVTTDT